MKKVFLVFALCLISIFCSAEILHRQFRLSSNYLYNVEIYIPDNSGTGKLPSFIFIPGNGESNSNVNGLYVHGPLKYIRDNGWRPNFIVIGIQPLGGPAGASFTQNALDSLIANPIYRFDVNRFYGTGLSYGTASSDIYTRASVNSRYRPPAALIMFSITMTLSCGDVYNNTHYPCVSEPDPYGQIWNDFRFKPIPMWGMAGSGDSHYWKMWQLWLKMQSYPDWTEPSNPKRWTTYSGGHCCWNTYYDPAYKETINGVQMNIYEWALQFPLAALPVRFTEFYYNYSLNELVWTVSENFDNAYYEVEESTDGINWKTTIKVLPLPSTDVQTYKINL